MPRNPSDKFEAQWLREATHFVRRCEAIIGNTEPLIITPVRITGVPCAFFKPPNRIGLIPGGSNFEDRCLDAMATFWCLHEYERRMHNSRVALIPNTTAKPVMYPYGGAQWQYYRTKLRSKLYTV